MAMYIEVLSSLVQPTKGDDVYEVVGVLRSSNRQESVTLGLV